MQTRVIDAALRCIARVGVAKTTLDDIAREARCSRATLYRNFESKDALLAAVVRREVDDLSSGLEDAAGTAPDLPSAVTAMIVEARRRFDDHGALAFVLRHEPELVLGHFSLDGARPLLDAGAALVARCCAPYLDRPDALRFGEWCTRIFVSNLLSPSLYVALDDPGSVRRLVDDFLVPALSASPSLRSARRSPSEVTT